MHYDRRALSGGGRWYRRAAEAAQQLHANAEALRLLERAVELGRRELRLADRRGSPHSAIVEGYGSSRLQAGSGARSQLDPRPAPPLLRSLALAALDRGDFGEARASASGCGRAAERDGDDVLPSEGGYVLGIAAFWGGRARRRPAALRGRGGRLPPRAPGDARDALRARPEGRLPESPREHARVAGRPRGGGASARRGAGLRGGGRPPASTVTAYVFAVLLALDLGDEAGVRRYTAALEASGGRHEVRAVETAYRGFGGYVDVLDGDTAAGLTRIRAASRGRRAGRRGARPARFPRARADRGVRAGGRRPGGARRDRDPGARPALGGRHPAPPRGVPRPGTLAERTRRNPRPR